MKLRNKRKIKVKTKKIINSFKYAIQGFVQSFKSERNMKFHVLIMLVVCLMGCLLKINKWEWITCIILFGVVISAELFNTAIETVVDMITPYRDPKAKIAKDVAAAAVLVPAIASIIVGLIIFLPKIIVLF